MKYTIFLLLAIPITSNPFSAKNIGVGSHIFKSHDTGIYS